MPTVGRAQLFRASTRRYSSQVAEEPELTAVLGEDDADYLQRMVTLGSSISQAYDLAPIEVLLAMPNIPMTIKTIGAKVIVASLEQRQQWALLPALLSIPEFRRLAEVKNYGVGEQLFAALLRGQFAFASRHSGAAPDAFRTLDLAAKCNALHAPAVVRAVRLGYQSLGLESPERITELLDIGQTDTASLQRLVQQNNDGDGDKREEFGPIGSGPGRLTGGKFMGQIAWARKTQSVYTVLPAVLAALPRVSNLASDSRQRVLGALCGRDVDTVSEVQGLARVLGTVPDAFLWSQVTTNAVHNSGPTDAAAIIQHVYNHVSDGYVAYHAVHQVISALAGRIYLAVPSREAVQLAWELFELHRTKGGDRALHIRRDEIPGTLMTLVSALMADINIPQRETSVKVLARYTEAKKLVGEEDHGSTWAGTLALLAALPCTSHLDALEAALAEPGGPLTQGDLNGLFRVITQFRYPDATVAPIAVLLRTLSFARDKGLLVDQYYPWTYIRSIANSLLRLHADMGAGLRSVICGGESDKTVPEQHMSQALVAIRQVEKLCQDPESGLKLDAKIVSALYFAYSVHNNASEDAARLRSAAMYGSRLTDPATGTRLLDGARTYAEVQEVWAVLSSQGLQQRIDLRCRYATKLLSLHHYYVAVEFARRNIPDDPNEPEVVRCVAWLLLSTETTQFKLTAREALPVTAGDARTREAINKLISHRRRMGLTGKTIVSDF